MTSGTSTPRGPQSWSPQRRSWSARAGTRRSRGSVRPVKLVSRAVQRQGRSRLSDADLRFHQLLVREPHSPRLLPMHGTLLAETRMCMTALQDTSGFEATSPPSTHASSTPSRAVTKRLRCSASRSTGTTAWPGWSRPTLRVHQQPQRRRHARGRPSRSPDAVMPAARSSAADAPPHMPGRLAAPAPRRVAVRRSAGRSAVRQP